MGWLAGLQYVVLFLRVRIHDEPRKKEKCHLAFMDLLGLKIEAEVVVPLIGKLLLLAADCLLRVPVLLLLLLLLLLGTSRLPPTP